MTEKQLINLGWKLTKQYNHDIYHTNRYQLGCMDVEFTYEGTKLESVDVTITELIGMPINYKQAKLLTHLLGHWAQ